MKITDEQFIEGVLKEINSLVATCYKAGLDTKKVKEKIQKFMEFRMLSLKDDHSKALTLQAFKGYVDVVNEAMEKRRAMLKEECGLVANQ